MVTTLVHSVAIRIPTQCGDCKKALPDQVRAPLLEEAKLDFARWFGGAELDAEVKVKRVQGYYVFPADGTLAEEEVDIVGSNCTSDALEAHHDDLAVLAVRVANELSQDTVALSIDNEMTLYDRTAGIGKCLHAKKGAAPAIPTSIPAGRKPKTVTEKMRALYAALDSFSSLKTAKYIFVELLDYDLNHTDDSLPWRDWPKDIKDRLTDAPQVIAHSGEFKIVYLQQSGDQLSRGTTRAVISRILRDNASVFYGLFVVSNEDCTEWELVNARLVDGKANRLILRRLQVGKSRGVRTATERLATLEATEQEDAATIQARHDKAFDVEAVTKAFFAELANWYFWALKHVSFPKDSPKEADGHDHIAVIRMITRLIFCWFVKEKDLIPKELFNQRLLDEMLEGFAPDKDKKKESVFYKAILQNMFFATLNTEMDKRGWAKDDQNFMAHSLYRYRDLFKKPDEALALFKNIPFLNGGLFECLDKDLGADVNPRYKRIDGFSRRPDSQPVVPDFLFFGAEREEDLSADYNDKKFRKVRVRGLIHTLNRYHFTIEENTPLEQEVALDPELSGKVFENLLAAYNPETGATARKQTGSFYTPREIVDYMVDEALIAYLKGSLTTENTEVTEKKLRRLMSWDESGHDFNPQETEALIAAIDKLKALDPAVGSGAFPMGLLHKLVFVLGKLDPRNERWKLLQVQRVRDAIATAENIQDATIRELTVKEMEQQIVGIEEAFERNELDYGRKLYLIENCLYGVDIQPIAVQISKMRFFISLIVDQKIDPNAPNLGVRPLPNLETNFVTANTLIGIERPKQTLLRDPQIEKKEAELRRVRGRHFMARTLSAKAKCREQDKKLRIEIANLLKSEGWGDATAKKLADWDPYDQNDSAPFFDPEWMFGITDGFDVLIGNPPYVDSESMVKHFPNLREAISLTYKTTKGNWDLYIAFYEKAYILLKATGFASYITPNKWLSAPYGKALRAFFHMTSSSIVNCSKIKVFEAGNTPIIFSFGALSKTMIVSEYDEAWEIHLVDKIEKSTLKDDNWGILLSSNLKTIRILEAHADRVKNMCSVENPFSTSEAYVLTEIVNDNKNYNNSFRLITTGAIDPFETLWGKKTTSYLKSKYEYPIVSKSIFKKTLPRRFEQQNCSKIAISGMRYFEAFYDIDGNYLSSKSTIIAKKFKDRNTGYYLLGLFNSSLISFYLKESYGALGIDGGINFSKEMVEEIPLPTIYPINEISIISNFLSLIKVLISTVEYYEYFLLLLNAMVYELYFPEEIKSANAEVLKHLTGLTELKDEWSDEKKIAVIEKYYKELSAPKHPVSIAIEKMKTVPEVRLIEGLTAMSEVEGEK